MAKVLQLRFLDETDKEKPTFVTLFMEGEREGMFKREPKDLVVKSAEGTTCKTQKSELLEVRQLGYPWKQLEERRFKLLLNEFNDVRVSRGWTAIELPVKDDNVQRSN